MLPVGTTIRPDGLHESRFGDHIRPDGRCFQSCWLSSSACMIATACQSASNWDPGSASKKDPPAGRAEGAQRRDRRRGAGQGERSGVDVVSSLPPLRSRRAAAGFLRNASSAASWRCRSPGCHSGASAGRAKPWSSSRRRTRSATRQTAGSSSRSPRCARRAG